MQKQTKAYFFAIAAVLLWSTVATAFKTALKEMTFTNLLFISTFISFIILFVITLVKKQIATSFKISFREWINSAIMGFLNPFLYYLVLLKAYSLLPAQIAQPLNYTWPVVLVVLSAPFLGHKVTWKTMLALLISFLGVIIISLQGKWNFSISSPAGIILAAGSSIIWAVFWLTNLKDKRPESNKLFLNFFFGLIYITIYMFFKEEIRFSFTQSFYAAIYVGFFEMGFTFVLWLTALKLSSTPEKISSLVFLSPFLSIFFISTFLNESIHLSTVIGLCFIVVGIVLSKTQMKFSG